MTSVITLYHTSHCPNCHSQEKILNQLLVQTPSLELKSINLEQSPEVQLTPARQSVPTLLIDNYRFEGLMPAAEITRWLGPKNHDKAYINDLLKSGHLDMALAWLQQHPAALTSIPELLADEDIELTVRIGLDALFEQLAASVDLSSLTPLLGKLLDDASDSLCIDILYYLAMLDSPEALEYIKAASHRSHPEVQRVAQELLSELEPSP